MIRAIALKRLAILGLLLLAALPASRDALAHGGAAHKGANTGATEPNVPGPWGRDFQDLLNGCVDEAGLVQINAYRRLAGLGDTKYPIISLVDEEPDNRFTGDFYSQGMILQYGFNFPESIKSFLKVLTFDSNAALAYWGIALASSSNINSTATDDCDALSDEAALRARRLAADQTGAQKYIDLFGSAKLEQQLDYAKTFFRDPEAEDPTMPRDRADKDQYAANMKQLSEKYNTGTIKDYEAATLYANALLNIDPWKWWNPKNGDPFDMVPTAAAAEALAQLRYVLDNDPDNIGANHFYIHAIEESLQSELGEPMAEKLRHLAPSSGHLVHMTSHILQRIGDNAGSSAANYRAVQVDRALMAQLNAASGPNAYDDAYPLHYLGHNIHFLTWTLSIEGRENDSLEMSRELIENTKLFGAKKWLCENFEAEIRTKRDYYLAASIYFAVRFRNWAALERNWEKSRETSNQISTTCGFANELDLRARTGVPNVDQDWAKIIPYTYLIQLYAGATKHYDTDAFKSYSSGYVEEFWQNSKDIFQKDPKLAYGTNDAFELIRIANLTFLGHMYQACQTFETKGECDRIVKSTLGPTLFGIVKSSDARDLYDDAKPFLIDPSSETWIGLWEKAVELQDALNYNEPPDWYYTSRESLGFAHLANADAATDQPAKKAAAMEAKSVFADDLKLNRDSGRSLYGQRRAMEILGEAPGDIETRFKEAWANANISADMNARVDQRAPTP
jgi:hypothetical protein